MSVSRDHDELMFECDICGDYEQTDLDFAQAWDQLKRDGWRVRKEGSDWVHACAKCRFAEVHRSRK